MTKEKWALKRAELHRLQFKTLYDYFMSYGMTATDAHKKTHARIYGKWGK